VVRSLVQIKHPRASQNIKSHLYQHFVLNFSSHNKRLSLACCKRPNHLSIFDGPRALQTVSYAWVNSWTRGSEISSRSFWKSLAYVGTSTLKSDENDTNLGDMFFTAAYGKTSLVTDLCQGCKGEYNFLSGFFKAF